MRRIVYVCIMHSSLSGSEKMWNFMRPQPCPVNDNPGVRLPCRRSESCPYKHSQFIAASRVLAKAVDTQTRGLGLEGSKGLFSAVKAIWRYSWSMMPLLVHLRVHRVANSVN
jgi:hypothetical protein